MKKLLLSLFTIIIGVSAFVPTTTFASQYQAKVVYYKTSCDYFVVKDTSGGYPLLELFGGNTPDVGDLMFGKFRSYGFQDYYNYTADDMTRAYVEDWLLSVTSAAKKYADKCNVSTTNSNYSVTPSALPSTNYYINTNGNTVQSPTYSPSVPVGASAKCKDGTYSFSQTRSGTCSFHGGVASWLK